MIKIEPVCLECGNELITLNKSIINSGTSVTIVRDVTCSKCDTVSTIVTINSVTKIGKDSRLFNNDTLD